MSHLKNQTRESIMASDIRPHAVLVHLVIGLIFIGLTGFFLSPVVTTYHAQTLLVTVIFGLATLICWMIALAQVCRFLGNLRKRRLIAQCYAIYRRMIDVNGDPHLIVQDTGDQLVVHSGVGKEILLSYQSADDENRHETFGLTPKVAYSKTVGPLTVQVISRLTIVAQGHLELALR